MPARLRSVGSVASEIARLAEGLTGALPDAAALDRLYAGTEGNPLFVIETLRPERLRAAPRACRR